MPCACLSSSPHGVEISWMCDMATDPLGSYPCRVKCAISLLKNPPLLCCAHCDKPVCSDVSGDNYWVIDTDYDNYAITYACRSLKEDGSCDDGYSLIFSRNPRGLPPAIQRIVRQKQEEICMSGQFQPVLQSGTWG